MKIGHVAPNMVGQKREDSKIADLMAWKAAQSAVVILFWDPWEEVREFVFFKVR